MPFDPTFWSAIGSWAVAAGERSEAAMPHTSARTVGRVSSLGGAGRIRVGVAIQRRHQRVSRLDAKRLTTSYAPQLRGRAVQRHPVGATRTDGIWSERCPCHDRPPAGARVDDFEAVLREDHCAVAHQDNRFLWAGAEHGVPRAAAEWAFYIDHQASPPFCWRRSPAPPYTHVDASVHPKGTARSARSKVEARTTRGKGPFRWSVVGRTLVQCQRCRAQYACAHTASATLGLSHHMHVLGVSGERNSGSGSTRTVAAVACLISASQAADPQNPP